MKTLVTYLVVAVLALAATADVFAGSRKNRRSTNDTARRRPGRVVARPPLQPPITDRPKLQPPISARLPKQPPITDKPRRQPPVSNQPPKKNLILVFLIKQAGSANSNMGFKPPIKEEEKKND